MDSLLQAELTIPAQVFVSVTRVFIFSNFSYNPPTLGSGVLDLPKLSSPLPPSALGPSPPDVGPNSSIRTLYVYWGQNLVDVDQILRRGEYPTLYVFFITFRFERIAP